MNRENLLRVADAIEKHEIDLGYNQKDWVRGYAGDVLAPLPDRSGHMCGTTACLSGWCAAVFYGRVPTVDEAVETDRWGSFLGLNDEEQVELFSAWPISWGDEEITHMDAVRTLRYAAAHNVIDWDAAQTEAA